MSSRSSMSSWTSEKLCSSSTAVAAGNAVSAAAPSASATATRMRGRRRFPRFALGSSNAKCARTSAFVGEAPSSWSTARSRWLSNASKAAVASTSARENAFDRAHDVPRPHGVVRGGRFETRVHHAVLALRVAARVPVLVPLGLFEQLLVRGRVAFAEQIARLLPAEQTVARHPPRRAVVVFLAGQKVEEEGAGVELPLLLAGLVRREDRAEQLARLLLGEEVILIRRLLVAIAGRDHHPVDLQLVGQVVEEPLERRRIGAVEDRRVRGDAKTARFRRLDRADGDVVDAVARDRMIVDLARPVEMNAEREVGRGRELVEARLEPDGVGAKVDELLARHQAAHDLVDLRVQQRFAARDRDDRRAALLDRREALLGREVTAQDLDRVLDLAAPAAGEVAAKERLEHED